VALEHQKLSNLPNLLMNANECNTFPGFCWNSSEVAELVRKFANAFLQLLKEFYANPGYVLTHRKRSIVFAAFTSCQQIQKLLALSC
jgi:hypothetical protein